MTNADDEGMGILQSTLAVVLVAAPLWLYGFNFLSYQWAVLLLLGGIGFRVWSR